MDSIPVTKVAATLLRFGEQLAGMLHFTRHHMIFRSGAREVWISYPIVAEVTRRPASQNTRPAVLRIVCKDFMFLCFEFENDKDCKDVYTMLMKLTNVVAVEDLYAYIYSPAPPERHFDGWSLYNPVDEYRRMGVNLDEDGPWRVTSANEQYMLCPTYPGTLVVPRAISDNVLSHAAKFRSKGRFPVLSYYHELNRCTISRCSQPLVGIKQNRSFQDEKLVATVYATTSLPSGVWGAQVDNLVVDLRPSTNALAQFAMGGGTENMDRYRSARKIYSGIDNLHVMRDSMNKVVDCLRHGDVSASPPNSGALEKSQWLHHVRIILDAARQVVQQVHFKCSHVLVHCSDGWDRTPQITSLSMLLLDPYYRTLEGFMVLIEKEWVSFGHQFATRDGILTRRPFTEVSDDTAQNMLNNVTSFITETTRARQNGPIFLQFLDCVHQILSQHPPAFEFNERFLRRLLYHSYACQYGTFLFDSEREQLEQRGRERTRSVWDYFLARRAQFVNPDYVPTDNVLLPSDRVKWWAAAFGRPDRDMNDPNAWRSDAENQGDIKQPSPSLSASVANAGRELDQSSDPDSESELKSLSVTSQAPALGLAHDASVVDASVVASTERTSPGTSASEDTAEPTVKNTIDEPTKNDDGDLRPPTDHLSNKFSTVKVADNDEPPGNDGPMGKAKNAFTDTPLNPESVLS